MNTNAHVCRSYQENPVTQVELRYCPFCGSSAQADYGDSSVGDVHCSNLDCPLHELLACTVDEWNTRTPSPATGSAVPASTVTAKDIQHLKTIAQGIEDGGWHIAALHLTAIRQKLEATVAPSPVGEGQPVAWRVNGKLFDSEFRAHEYSIDPQTLVRRWPIQPLHLAAQAPKPASGGGDPRDTALGLMKERAQKLHKMVYDLCWKYPNVPEFSDNGVLHDAIHDVLRVDTPTAIAAEADTAKDGAK